MSNRAALTPVDTLLNDQSAGFTRHYATASNTPKC
jgi:hypothetical protein